MVARDFPPRCLQGRRSDDLVHQTVPLAPFDAVAQRRHHALRPDRCFRPPPLTAAADFCPLRSLFRHSRGGLLRHSKPRTSNFLPPFPRSGFASRPFHRSLRHQYYEGCDSCRRHQPAGLSAYSALPSRHSGLNHASCPPVALSVASALAVVSRLRHERAGSPQTYAESGSSSSGLPVHLRLLPTPPRGDAVTFDCGACDRLRRGLAPRCQSVLTDALPRKRESRSCERFVSGPWTPACAGTTSSSVRMIS